MLNITPLWSSIDDRLLAAQISHISGLYDFINIFVMYVPAQYRERVEFLRSFLTTMPFDQSLPSRSILLGDFNQICQRSRKEGGLTILDPGTQHVALQLRWLQPLLLPSSDSPYYDTFISDILRHCLRLFSVSPSHILSLLLPNMRSNAIKSFNCFSSLFRTMDKIDYKINR
ncbi:hypothetical protein G6F47_000932 [Rhizopus delemar]|nr:hypothetical protein G6F49_006191 [Rhizopus delemar]KAG1604440.1 hypothetical protein G6F47_000932 [Rhizopus delemar]